MRKFGDVRAALAGWLTSMAWVRAILPYHLHLMFGGLGLMLLFSLMLAYGSYVHVLFLLSTIGYWLFVLGALLTLITPNVRMLAYGLWAYVLVFLFPFQTFGFAALLRAVLFAAAGFLVFRYAAAERGRL